jgi:hypothetical protein
VSFGIVLWTSGWIMDRLPDRPRLERALTVTLIVSGVIEVALTAVQSWRRVPSHFNIFATVDSAVFAAMGVSVAVFSVALAALFLWSLVERPADRATRLVVLAGMTLVMAGLGLGAWIIGLGLQITQQLGQVPETVLAGEAGVAKFPHAMALHGIQLFIAGSLLGQVAGMTERARLRVTRMIVAGYGLLVGWSILHTNAGRSPTDLSGVEIGLSALGIVLLVAAAFMLFAAWRRLEPAGEDGGAAG